MTSPTPNGAPIDILLAGHRGFESVVGLYDAFGGSFTETWASADITTGGRYIAVSGLGETGDCVLVGESFLRAPEITVIAGGHYRPVKSFDLGYAEEIKTIEAVERVTWSAPDGLEIQGWLLRPKAAAPHPLIMHVHGGPVWHSRPRCLARASLNILMSLKRGYVVFLPNPRGSTGRGRDFVRHVVADMGGADTYDLLSGVDYLVDQAIADAHRLGVTGGSYGGS